MPDFIKDNTTLQPPKTNFRTNPAALPGQKASAGDWNEHRQALLDIQSYLRSEITINVRNFGAKGDGVTDDTGAINAAITAARVAAGANVLGATLYFPPGKYLVGTTLTPPGYVTFKGDSRYTATIQWIGGAGRVFEFADKQGVGFQDLRVSLPVVTNPSTVTAFYLSNCFRFTFHRVIIDGNHTVATPDPQSTGIEFRNNAGDNRVVDCDLNNLGAGIRTSAIQNYVVGSVFGTNKYGIYGDGGTFSAGMVVQSCTFVSKGDTGLTPAHIIVDRSANMWRIIGCWFEGCRKGIQIGATGVGGPTEFGIIGCKIAAVDLAIDVQNCTLPYLANLTLAADLTGTPVGSYADIAINATDAPNGTAMGLRAGTGFDLDPAVFPAGWTLMRRGAMRLPNLVDVTDALSFSGDSTITFETTTDTTPVVIKKNNAGNTNDIVQIKKVGSTYAWVDTFGVFYAQAVGGLGYVQTGSGSTRWYTGTGSPEGVVTATVGSLYSRTNGDAGTTLYVKVSGSGNTGWLSQGTEVVPAQITANQNDYSPAGMATAATLLINSDAARDVTGIATGVNGRWLWVYNTGGFNITLKHLSGSSSAGNQIRGRGAADTVLTPSTGAQLYYSPSLVKWVVMTDTL